MKDQLQKIHQVVFSKTFYCEEYQWIMIFNPSIVYGGINLQPIDRLLTSVQGKTPKFFSDHRPFIYEIIIENSECYLRTDLGKDEIRITKEGIQLVVSGYPFDFVLLQN